MFTLGRTTGTEIGGMWTPSQTTSTTEPTRQTFPCRKFGPDDTVVPCYVLSVWKCSEKTVALCSLLCCEVDSLSWQVWRCVTKGRGQFLKLAGAPRRLTHHRRIGIVQRSGTGRPNLSVAHRGNTVTRKTRQDACVSSSLCMQSVFDTCSLTMSSHLHGPLGAKSSSKDFPRCSCPFDMRLEPLITPVIF